MATVNPPQITRTSALPRLPKSLIASTTFLLKRLGYTAKERAMEAYEETGLHPYHYGVLSALGEGSHETQGSIADALGYDSVKMVEHHFTSYGGYSPDPSVFLAACAQRAPRMRMVTGAVLPAFNHPLKLAGQLAMLDALCGGRLDVGVARAFMPYEFDGFGVSMEESRPRFEEGIRALRRLWTEERVTFEGEYYETKDATVYDKPDTPIPVYVAAGGPLVARYAGRSGDGFICTSGKGEELYVDKLLPAVDEGLEKSGRTRDDIDRMIEIKLSWDPDHDQAVANTRFWAALALTAEQKHGTSDPLEMEKLGDELSDEQVASRWIVSADPEEVVAKVKQYVDWGFDHLVFHGPGHDQSRFLTTFAQQVLPGLRALG